MKYVTIVAPNPPTEHLKTVVEEMKRRGSPKLRCYYDGQVWHALEGSHRICAAVHLQLPIIVVSKKLSDRVKTDVLNRRVHVSPQARPWYEVQVILECP